MAIYLEATVDSLNIKSAIANAVTAYNDRGRFVQDLMNASFDCAGKRYNVMIFNNGFNCDKQFNGLKFEGLAKMQSGVPPFVGTYSYRVWIFEDGTFRNRGDGGWINWGFKGWFDRNGNSVSFRKPGTRTEEAQQFDQPDEEVPQELLQSQ